MTIYGSLRRASGLVLLVALLAVPSIAVAASKSGSDNNGQTTQSVTQAYGTDGTLQQGMIVRLDEKNATKVVALESDKLAQMQGVVVSANDAALTLSSATADRVVYVATYGRYLTLVSNQNGPINKGDYIGISALNGVGMKASSDQATVLGKAVESFDGSGNVIGTASLKNAEGKSVQVSLGRIMVDLSIGHNPLYSTGQTFGVTGVLKKISTGVAGKEVNPARIYLGLVVFLVSGAVAGAVLWSGVRSGIVAIGRNPLAKQSIIRGLIQVVFTSIIIFVIGLFGVYLLLKF